MRKYLASFFPSAAAIISMLILPFLLTSYFVVTQYSDRFITEQGVSYADVQTNLLGKLLLNQNLIDMFNRFTDFAVWGIVAIVVLIVLWVFGNAKVSLQNHYTQEEFKNFNVSKQAWHQHFFVVAMLKISLIAVAMYAFMVIIVKIIPLLATNLSVASETLSQTNIWPVVQAELYLFLLQVLIVTCLKVFRHVRAD